MTSVSQEQNSGHQEPCSMSFYLKPPQFIGVAPGFLPKVLNKKNLDGEGWMQGETLDCMWGLRVLILCKLNKTQHKGQQRLETLQDP